MFWNVLDFENCTLVVCFSIDGSVVDCSSKRHFSVTKHFAQVLAVTTADDFIVFYTCVDSMMFLVFYTCVDFFVLIYVMIFVINFPSGRT